MTKDFSKYQAIIDEFRGKVLADNFEARFANSAQAVPKTERFLLKMELKRLATPCTRLIDLRGHVDGECRAFEHDGRTHFLDDLAIKVYEEAYSKYGSYSFGVYEAVMNTENNFRVIYQKEKANIVNGNTVNAEPAKVFEKTQYPAELFSFGPFFDRRDERMNFAISVQVSLDENNAAEGTTSDISVNGCKFRFNKAQELSHRQLVQIRFTGLEGDFQFGKNEAFTYEIRNIQEIDGIQLVGAQRVYTSDESRDGFKQFLTGFIQGNKRRYKINLDNTITAVQARTLEQFALPKSNELPIFLSDNGQSVLPRYALTCHNNQRVFQYWQDESRQSTLNFLVTADRVMRLKKSVADGETLLVYSFIHSSHGKAYFYTADNIQLKDDPDFARQFLGFASNKDSFAIHQLQLLPVVESRAHSPLTLSNNISARDQHLNLPVAEDVKVILSQLTNIVVANRLELTPMLAFYQALAYDNINTSKLKNFGHKRLIEPLLMDEVGINFNNQRTEPRFQYKTEAIVGIDGVTWTGVSKDFSMSGLKIELNKASVLNRGDVC